MIKIIFWISFLLSFARFSYATEIYQWTQARHATSQQIIFWISFLLSFARFSYATEIYQWTQARHATTTA
ncbi:hypothetical protein BMR11_01885, partial [Methylococcaceae bacterium CS5]